MSKKYSTRLNITVGADPEVFLVDQITNKPVPAIGKIGGTKYKPLVVRAGALLEDNVMAEINITPCKTSNEFIKTIHTVFEQLVDKVKPFGLVPKIVPTMMFPTGELKHYNEALDFGCEPDYNIYTLQENKVLFSQLRKTGLRTAGGHLHIGITNSSGDCVLDNKPMGRFFLGLACELTVGLATVALDDDLDRKPYYGRAGSHRIKSYGIEYRVPSNFWLLNDVYMKLMFDLCVAAARAAYASEAYLESLAKLISTTIKKHKKNPITLSLSESYLNIPEIINTKNKPSALGFINTHNGIAKVDTLIPFFSSK